jgi:hypothetical protein
MKIAGSIIAGTVIAVVCSSLVGCERPAIIETRIEDVRRLVQLHSECGFTNTEISQLLRLAKEKGIKISNPIAKDPTVPCYRIVVNDTNGFSSVVIEETSNVSDREAIVRGYAAGHVSLERKK